MDETIAKWILEYIIRKSTEERLINGLIKSLPSLGDDYSLKKIILLRKIEFEVENSEISEDLMELLEVIEELDHQEGRACSDSMKSAYSAVMLDCIVRFLDDCLEINVNNPKYFDAVKRLWKNRGFKIKSLASDDSRLKMEEVETAMWDSKTCAKLLQMNTRFLALTLVRVYVKEQWSELGPSFLELMASISNVGNKLKELCHGGNYGETQKNRSALQQKHINVKKKCGNADKILPVDEETQVITGKTLKTPAPEVDKVPAAIEPTSMEMDQQAFKKIDLPNAQAAETLQNAMDNIDVETLVENQPAPKMDASPEVERVQEPLKSNSMELHAAVRDPLPDALQTETVAETHASPRANIGEIKNHQAQHWPTHITVRKKLGQGAKIAVIDLDEEDDVLMQETVKIPPSDLPSSENNVLLQETVKIPPSDLPSSENNVLLQETVKTPPSEKTWPNHSIYLQENSAKVDLPNAKAAQTQPDVLGTPVVNRPSPKMYSTPEVEQAQDALKSSSMELRASVGDALQTAQNIRRTVSKSDLLLLLSLRDMEFEDTDLSTGTCADNDKEHADKAKRDHLQTTATSGSADNRNNEHLEVFTDGNTGKIAGKRQNPTHADNHKEDADKINIESDVRDRLQTTGAAGSTDDRIKEQHLATFSDSNKEKIAGKRQIPTQDPKCSEAQHEANAQSVERRDATDKLPRRASSSSSSSKRPHLPTPEVNKPSSPLKKYDNNEKLPQGFSPSPSSSKRPHSPSPKVNNRSSPLKNYDNDDKLPRGACPSSSSKRAHSPSPKVNNQSSPSKNYDNNDKLPRCPPSSSSKRPRSPSPKVNKPSSPSKKYDNNDELPQAPSPSSSSKRPRLPSSPQVNKPPSPLKKYNSETVVRRRRRTTLWSPEEENALREGVAKFGKGSWKEILMAYWDVFAKNGRTDVDLKDKWRTLTKKR